MPLLLLNLLRLSDLRIVASLGQFREEPVEIFSMHPYLFSCTPCWLLYQISIFVDRDGLPRNPELWKFSDLH